MVWNKREEAPAWQTQVQERIRISWHLGEPHGFLITHQYCDWRRKHSSTHLEERRLTECATRLQSDKNLNDDITRPSPRFPNSATVCIPEAEGNPNLHHVPWLIELGPVMRGNCFSELKEVVLGRGGGQPARLRSAELVERSPRISRKQIPLSTYPSSHGEAVS